MHENDRMTHRDSSRTDWCPRYYHRLILRRSMLHLQSCHQERSRLKLFQLVQRCLYTKSVMVVTMKDIGNSLESTFIIPPDPLTSPPYAVPLLPEDALPPVAPFPAPAQPVLDAPPVPALLELRFMIVGIPPLSPALTLPPSTAPEVPVCAFPPVV